MAKSTEKAEKNEAQSGAIDELKAQLDELKAQLEDLLKGAAADKTAEAEAQRIEAEKEAQRAMEPVEIYIDKGAMKSNQNVEVAINGVQYIIKKGERVTVPRCVAEVIRNSEHQKDLARGLMEEKNSEYRRAEAEGVFR